MAALKISDREEVMRRVLRDSFAPRFAGIQKQLQEHVHARLIAEHPKFLKMAKDEESRRYLAVSNVRNFYFIDEETCIMAASPKYGKRLEMPTRGWFDRDDYERIQDTDSIVPTSFCEVKVSDKKMFSAYKKTWADYVDARNKMSALLNSYSTREKLEGDFPEFGKYLPAIEKKASLPMVIVKDVRRDLRALGISA